MDNVITLEVFYRYGHMGREMVAARSPFQVLDSSEFIGRFIRLDDRIFVVTAVGRLISGPVQKGEPLGLQIEVLRVKSSTVNNL